MQWIQCERNITRKKWFTILNCDFFLTEGILIDIKGLTAMEESVPGWFQVCSSIWCQPHSHHQPTKKRERRRGRQIKCIFHSNFRVFSRLRRRHSATWSLLGTVGSYDSGAHFAFLRSCCVVSEKLNLFLFTFVLMDNLQNHLSLLGRTFYAFMLHNRLGCCF